MLKVGLTGSIAVGKSFVAETFSEMGCYVLDSDQSAREVVEPNTKGWKAIVENFGVEIIRLDKTIDREKLGAIVFADEKKRQLLNSIVHPLVFEKHEQWLQDIEKKDVDAIAIIDAALMIESGSYKRFDKIIVVWCEAEIQIQRLMRRNSFNRSEAIKRINAQMSQDEKKNHADFLIETSKGYEETRKIVKEVYDLLTFIKLNGF